MKFTLPFAGILFVLVFTISTGNSCKAQELTGTQLLDKAIAFHDPSNHWPTFKGNLNVTMTTPNRSPRVSAISINLPEEYFSITAKRDTVTTTYTLNKDVCTTSVKQVPEEEKRTPCETAAFYKNYYTYLYGLPMKLKDNGTNISEKVTQKKFKGKKYLVLKVSYDEAVGSDIWYFYFDPKTYAMEVYQFFKTENGSLKIDSGEYILLSEITTVNDIKFPKKRAWFYNNGDKYLGTDTLK